MTNDALIKRARELAALRKWTTPGRWIAVGHWVIYPPVNKPDICYCNPAGFGEVSLNRSEKEICANAKLISVAPEMAALLEQLADRLEKLESWARPMLEQYGTELARIGEK